MLSSLLAVVIVLHGVVARAPTVRTELRSYICQVNDCRLEFEGARDEWIAINDNGCYKEYEEELEETVEFCPLQCNGSTDAVIIEQIPASESCVVGSTVNVVQRRNDWFLWRGEECQKEPTMFKIGCTFDARLKPGKKEEKQPMTKPTRPRMEGTAMLVPASPLVMEEIEITTTEKTRGDADIFPKEVDLLLKATPAQKEDNINVPPASGSKAPKKPANLHLKAPMDVTQGKSNTERTTSNDDDQLPSEIDLLLKAMFPSYRD